MALIAALVLGGGLIITGYTSLGKGLILGSLFSVLNFLLMALVIPYHVGHGRGKSFLIPLTSICGRFALMAIPLIYSVKHSQIAVSTVAIGLFIIPISILGEQLWERWRHSEEVGI
jgi:uncharacterized membrane protein YadS